MKLSVCLRWTDRRLNLAEAERERERRAMADRQSWRNWRKKEEKQTWKRAREGLIAFRVLPVSSSDQRCSSSISGRTDGERGRESRGDER